MSVVYITPLWQFDSDSDSDRDSHSDRDSDSVNLSVAVKLTGVPNHLRLELRWGFEHGWSVTKNPSINLTQECRLGPSKTICLV